MKTDEELAYELQAQFDLEAKTLQVASTSHSMSDSDSEGAISSKEGRQNLKRSFNDKEDDYLQNKISKYTADDISGDTKPLCRYGSKCYRMNPDHLTKFSHPAHNSPAEVCPRTKVAKHEDKGGALRGKKSQQEHLREGKGEEIDPESYKLPFPERLERSLPFCVFLNKSYSVTGTHKDPLSLVFLDIFNPAFGDLVQSAQLNFMVDLDFLMEHYKKAGISTKPLLVMYGEMDPDKCSYENVTCIKVQLPFQYGTHHTKIMLLEYEKSFRVVVHTANLVPDDWYEKTQGYWISPMFPLLDKPGLLTGESLTGFKRDLHEYLVSYKETLLTRWAHIIKKYDFSSCNVFFIGSSPGFHVGESKKRWGHMKVRRIIGQHCNSWRAAPILPVIIQCSSIGSLGKDAKSWLCGEFGASLSGRNNNTPQLNVKVVYPSEDDVRSSSQGYCGGSCLPYTSKTHTKQLWLQDHLNLWRSEIRCRSKAMPHIKTYTRLSADLTSAQYFLLTSANISKAAWGQLQKQESQLFVRSYEAGVLFVPKFVDGSERFDLSRKLRFGKLSLPYDIPLSAYSSTCKPWLVDTNKSALDSFGHSYP